MSKGYPSDWDSRRKEVYKRDGFTCQNCGAQGGPHGNTELNAHHIIPKSKGGTHSTSNLVTICKSCHNAVHYDHQAPLPTQANNRDAELIGSHTDELEEILSKFGKTCIDASDFVGKIKGDLAILSDGTLENKELEKERIELIQRLGTVNILLDSFEGDYKVLDDIKSNTETLISLFTTFETVGGIIEDDSLTASEKRQIIEPKISRKLQEVAQKSKRTKKSIDEFDRKVNRATKAVENEQKSSSFISRLFDL